MNIEQAKEIIISAIHDALEQKIRLRMILLALKSNKPRPQAKFETQNISGNERTDKKKYQNELGNAYPEGVTETEKQEERKKITKRLFSLSNSTLINLLISLQVLSLLVFIKNIIIYSGISGS